MNGQPVSADAQALVRGLWRDRAESVAAPRRLRRLLLAVSALLAAGLIAAGAAPIGGAVIAGGQVAVSSQIKRIVHPTGGVIAEIPVHNGDHVRAGQVLLRLDNREAAADAQASARTVEQLKAQAARAEAEARGRPTVSFPAELADTRAMDDERRLLALHRAEASAMQGQLAARIAQYRAEITGLEAQRAALREQRRLIEGERQGMRDLFAKQLVTITRMNQIERSAVDLDGSVGSLSAQIAQARARMAEARAQAIGYAQTRRVTAAAELDQIKAALDQQQPRRTAASNSRDRSLVRAPYDGTIEKIAFGGIGDVIRPAEPIAEIVPDHDAMVVEARIAPGDIDHVHTGDAARVRLSNLSRNATPELAGTVIYVATDRSDAQDQKSAWYLVRIALDPTSLAREHVALTSGMPAEVHIAHGSRTLLSYLTKPLRDQFARAFRDN